MINISCPSILLQILDHGNKDLNTALNNKFDFQVVRALLNLSARVAKNSI